MTDSEPKHQEQLPSSEITIPRMDPRVPIFERLLTQDLAVDGDPIIIRLLKDLSKRSRPSYQGEDKISDAQASSIINSKLEGTDRVRTIAELKKYVIETCPATFDGQNWDEDFGTGLHAIDALQKDKSIQENPDWKIILGEVRDFLWSIQGTLRTHFTVVGVTQLSPDLRREVPLPIPKLPVPPDDLMIKLKQHPELKQLLFEALTIEANLVTLKKKLDQISKQEPQNIGPGQLMINPLELPEHEKKAVAVNLDQIISYGSTAGLKAPDGYDTPDDYIRALAKRALNLRHGKEDDAAAAALYGIIPSDQVKSITLRGVKMPDGTYQALMIGDGRHRILAAKIAGLSEVKATVLFVNAADTYVVDHRKTVANAHVFEGVVDGSMKRVLATSLEEVHQIFPQSTTEWTQVQKNGGSMRVQVKPPLIQQFGGMIRSTHSEDSDIEYFLIPAEPTQQIPVNSSSLGNIPTTELNSALRYYRNALRNNPLKST